MGDGAVPKQAAAAGEVIFRRCPTASPCRTQAPHASVSGLVDLSLSLSGQLTWYRDKVLDHGVHCSDLWTSFITERIARVAILVPAPVRHGTRACRQRMQRTAPRVNALSYVRHRSKVPDVCDICYPSPHTGRASEQEREKESNTHNENA